MKKFGILLLLTTVFLLPVNAALNTEKGTISVNTSANKEIAPDVAEITFSIITSDIKSMQIATNKNKEISENVLTELKNIIDEKNGDYIKTSNYNASPIYTYINSKKTFERYEVSNQVIVHTKSINNIGKMIDTAINTGASKVENLTFSASNYENQCNELITLATRKAQNRANAVAKALSASTSGIQNIVTSCNANNYNPPRLYMAKNMATDSSTGNLMGTSTPISNGVININANVNASFFIKY